ncbi:MAG: ComEA family DNA-binding protein [Aminobacteriaceae bacterium]
MMDGGIKDKLNRYAGFGFFAIGVACFLLAGLLVYMFSGRFVNTPSGSVAGPALTLNSRQSEQKTPASPIVDSAGGEALAERQEERTWVLYITGEVRSPGVYNLPSGSRVFHLVEAAGGMGPQADPVRINMASPLADGVHVHVPSIRSDGQGADIPYVPQSSVITLPPGISHSSTGQGVRINVNSASASELEALPGVGPATARAIIEHRERVGPFRTVEALMDVKGIGPKKLEGMRKMVAVQ